MDASDSRAYGIDREKGLRNCMGNAEFYKKILMMFLSDFDIARAENACREGNQQELFKLMHELKSTSGNVGLIRLYEATSALTELVRNGQAEQDKVNEGFAAVADSYAVACDGIPVLIAELGV